MVTAAKTATLETNAALIETVLQQERDQFVFEMNERLDETIRAVITNIRTEIGESVRDFLDVSANDAAISSLIGEVRRREATLLSR